MAQATCVKEASELVGRVERVRSQLDIASFEAAKLIDSIKSTGFVRVAVSTPDAIARALNLCPVCAGLPPLSITRCEMCRALQEAIG